MSRPGSHRPWPALWAGLLLWSALMLSAWGPVLARAAGATDAWGAVCSAMQPVPGDADSAPSSHASAGHCPWCTLSTQWLALPPSAPALASGGGVEPHLAPRRECRAAQAPAWAHCRSRAPPLRA